MCLHYCNIFFKSSTPIFKKLSTHLEVRNGLKEVIKRLEPDLNKQVRAINEVIIIYLFHRYNVMQILTLMMCILTDKIICGWSWRIWKLTD